MGLIQHAETLLKELSVRTGRQWEMRRADVMSPDTIDVAFLSAEGAYCYGYVSVRSDHVSVELWARCDERDVDGSEITEMLLASGVLVCSRPNDIPFDWETVNRWLNENKEE